MPLSLAEQLLARLSSAPDATAPPAGPARFDGVDLRAATIRPLVTNPPPAWWDEAGQRVRILRAELPGASLRSANLTGVSLENANLKAADLAEAQLADIVLGGADLTDALLEDANLTNAHLRFARLENAALEGAKCRDADLWGAKAHGADLDRIDFRDARLDEADLRDTDARECDFRGARLGATDFRDADLRRSDFRDTVLRSVQFDGADLRSARLEHVDLSNCTLTGVWMADARLDRTRLMARQLGHEIGEERAREWALAARGYLALERNFATLGDPDAVSWAYRRRRRMTKKEAGRLVRTSLRAGHVFATARHTFNWASDWLVELVCDYGESVARVFATYLVVVIGFSLTYAATGAIVREDGPEGPRTPTRTFEDVALYSMTAMLAPTDPPEGLYPAANIVQLATIVQSSTGIFLIGLLGFVAGNRIRR